MSRELIVREPELYFDSIHQELDNFLRDTFFSHTFGHPLNIIKNVTLRPAIEVIQNKENYKVKVQLPGIKKDNIDVEIDNDFMTITAETHEEKEEKQETEHNARYHTSEFRYGKYQRTISFDQPIKAEEADAKYKDGILTVTIPKQKVEDSKPKKLAIKTQE
ncbi:MAG: Hsp20/alpha crystallin family protein [Candidatus Gastranaerophilaceae bacterium]